MAAYVIADTVIADLQAYEEYRRRVAPQIAKFGGRFLVRGGKLAVREGTWQPQRLVVIEFPSMESLTAWYESPEYAPLKALRQRAATSHVVFVEGS